MIWRRWRRTKPPQYPIDMDEPTIRLYERVQPYTMTGIERIATLRQTVHYITKNKIPGDIVECGVWRGGSMMAIAASLLENHSTERTLYLFDTFEGMSSPTDVDKDYAGTPATRLLNRRPRERNPVWAYAPLESVKQNMLQIGYDAARTVYVKGKVEETLPQSAPQQIALLRLDTDWYESTYHELVHLYPRLAVGGVLIIDDYGYWQGARRAVDQYIQEHKLKLLLNRIDVTARQCVKLEQQGGSGCPLA
jgi:O-methyltransferase